METLRKIRSGESPHLAGWGLALCAVVFAGFAFPAVAQKTNQQRAQNYWGDKAAALANAGDRLEDLDISPVAEDYAELTLRSDLETPFQRDAYMLKTAVPISLRARQTALALKAEHVCLSEAVFYEARSEKTAGQKAVAEVILNRVRSKHYPDSVCGVVYQGSERRTGCQFSFTCDGSLDEVPSGKAWTRAQDIASLMLSSPVRKITQGATHYHTQNVQPVWSESLKLTKTIGTHKFYRTRWRERFTPSAALAVAPPSP
jgi:spore germination cell wall hydrolase CwlJ-like protein